MSAGNCTVGNSVVVDVEIASEFSAELFEELAGGLGFGVGLSLELAIAGSRRSIAHCRRSILAVVNASVNAIKLLRGEDLASIEAARVVPLKRFSNVVVHAEIEIGHDDHRCLQLLGQIECSGCHLKTFFRTSRKEQRMFRVTMRGIGGKKNI